VGGRLLDVARPEQAGEVRQFPHRASRDPLASTRFNC
jgi:hypothetical protein